MGEKVGKSRNLGLTLTPPHKFNLGKPPKCLKPVLDTPFQGLLLGKVWTTPHPNRMKTISPPQIFGGGVPMGYIS